MRQGNDQGTQYRSGIYYYTDEHRDIAKKTKELHPPVKDISMEKRRKNYIGIDKLASPFI